MGRRSFEMFQYRQVVVRLRHGETDREIARSRLMGRRKVMALRRLASERGWLSRDSPLPDDAAIAASLSRAARGQYDFDSGAVPGAGRAVGRPRRRRHRDPRRPQARARPRSSAIGHRPQGVDLTVLKLAATTRA